MQIQQQQQQQAHQSYVSLWEQLGAIMHLRPEAPDLNSKTAAAAAAAAASTSELCKFMGTSWRHHTPPSRSATDY
jgi:hypothetical protein